MNETTIENAPQPEIPQQAPQTAISCPNCGSNLIRESATGKPLDFIARVAGKNAYRCRSCRERFHARPPVGMSAQAVGAPPKKRTRESLWRSKRTQRKLTQAAIMATSMLLFALLLYLFTQAGLVLS